MVAVNTSTPIVSQNRDSVHLGCWREGNNWLAGPPARPAYRRGYPPKRRHHLHVGILVVPGNIEAAPARGEGGQDIIEGGRKGRGGGGGGRGSL